MRRLFYLLIALIPALPAQACYRVGVVNWTDQDMTIVWEAAGCAKVWKGYFFVCHHAEVSAGDTVSYDYNWGTTAPMVKLFYSRSVDNTDLNVKSKYSYHHEAFVPNSNNQYHNQSVSHCGKHATIYYSPSALKRDVNEAAKNADLPHW